MGKAENAACTDEELEEEIRTLAERNGVELEEFRAQLNENDLDYLRDRKAAEKVVALIVDNAVLTAPKAEPEAAAGRSARRADN